MKSLFILLFLCNVVSVVCVSPIHNTTESLIGQTGVTALWVGVVSHSFSALAYVIASKRCKETNQIYYHINIVICSIATTCYFLMAMRQSDYITEDGHLVFWARYVEFLLGTPLLLIDLCMMIQLPSATMFYICFMDILMIGAGWFATISTTITSKWVLFILGCIFFYPILDAVLGFTPEPKNREINSGHNRFVILYTAVVWNGYVILWILHDGFEWVSLDTECVMHTVLDILAKDLFGVVLFYNHNEPDIPPPVDSSSPRIQDHIDTGSIRRSSTGPPTRPNSGPGIRRSSTGPARSSREPQIVITPPVTNDHTPGQRRPSVSSDRPLISSEDSDNDIELSVYSHTPPPQRLSHTRRSKSQSPRPYREAEYDTDEIQRPSRSRSPSTYVQNSQKLPAREYSSVKTPDYEDDEHNQHNQHNEHNEHNNMSASQAAASPATLTRQNVLNRAIQTFDRIRQMI